MNPGREAAIGSLLPGSRVGLVLKDGTRRTGMIKQNRGGWVRVRVRLPSRERVVVNYPRGAIARVVVY